MTALPTRFRPDRFTLLAAAFAALGAALVRGHGVALATDAAYFIAFARSLLGGEGLLNFEGFPDTLWPPLYPLLLAAASLGTFDPVAVAGPLNAVVFGLTVFVVGRYLRQRLESRSLAAWGCLATALAPPLTRWSAWAHSETLFVLLAVLALIQADRFLDGGRLRSLVWAAAFSALAWQTRYVGGAVPAIVGLLLLLHPGMGASFSMARRAGHVAVYSSVAATPTALWFLRNFLVTGELTRHGPPPGYPVSMMLGDVLDILWSWALANGTAVLAPLVCVLVAARWKRLSVAGWSPVWVFGGFALAYLVLFVLAASLVVRILHGEVPRRYLVPLYVPLLVAGAFALDRVLVHERERPLLGSVGNLSVVRAAMPGKGGSVLAAIVAVVLSLGVANQAITNVSRIAKASRGELELGFNEPRWTGSETLRHVRENLSAKRERTYTNAPEPLSLHVNRNREYAPCCRRLRLRVDRLGRQLAEIPDDAHVVWFRATWNADLFDYGEAELRSLPVLEPVAELADGVVFRVKR